MGSFRPVIVGLYHSLRLAILIHFSLEVLFHNDCHLRS
uniref:Uncharacterized protein n=1 Tax=Arundo donax TaxID=35708 RepID=A0A0A9A5V0_ARUDO